jgi:leucyl aminopeptidase
MTDRVRIEIKPLDTALSQDVVLLAAEGPIYSPRALGLIGEAGSAELARAGSLEKFKGKSKSALSLLAPAGASCERLITVGMGSGQQDFVMLGGTIAGKLKSGRTASVIADIPGDELSAAAIAEVVLGITLRAYKFDRYKSRKDDDNAEDEGGSSDKKVADDVLKVTIHVADPAAVRKALKVTDALSGGIVLARDLVNEPPNVLHPEAFAKRIEELTKLGVEVEILDEKQMAKIGMRALLGVGLGSPRESRVAIMRWRGAKSSDKAPPIAFIGKGVTFDTGGISIKPAAGMEDMKGDMAGAACVVGLMHALAARKAKVDVIGAVGLVENMPDGAAQRPGDIVTSLSGQTIEIINTDAEGRLVLADVLWYINDRYKPAFMVNLATLTGAILVALAKEHAGMFCNDDTLAGRLLAAGEATGETMWRMPLGKAYDKMIDSKFADMKNTGGRYGGSITAAQFLKRFVGSTPWAHLDIAGTGMDSLKTEINQGWASGWGVRMLDRLVQDHYEK